MPQAIDIVPYRLDQHRAALADFLSRVLGEEVCRRRTLVHDAICERMPGRDRGPLRFLALDGARVVGSLGYLPADFLINGRRVPVRFTFDLLVDPAYAITGLRLARKTIGTLLVEHARLQGEFLAGGLWMTPTSHKIQLAAGFDDAVALPTYTLSLDSRAFVARRGMTGARAGAVVAGLSAMRGWALLAARMELATAGVQLEAVQRFDESLDAAWLELASSFRVTRVREASYLNWKYVDHPTLGYRVLVARRAGRPTGYIVWRLATDDDETERAVVVDWLVARGDGRTLRTLVSRAVVEAVRAHMDALSILVTQPWAAAALQRMGFMRRKGTNAWVLAGWREHVPAAWLSELEPWHLVMGDSDGDLWTGTTPAMPGKPSPLLKRRAA